MLSKMRFCILSFTPGVFEQTRERILFNSSGRPINIGLQTISSIDILRPKMAKIHPKLAKNADFEAKIEWKNKNIPNLINNIKKR